MATTEHLRMRDVCARTGLARSTIHHYIREGVLPRPTKTGRNTALYDEDFVQRAHLVKQLQQKTHMPLAAIRDALHSLPQGTAGTVDLETFASVTRTIADNLRLASERELTRDELAHAAGVDPLAIDGMAAAGLLDPIERDGVVRFSPLDARIALAVTRIREAGATVERGFGRSPEVVRAYLDHLTELARTEARAIVHFMPRLSELDIATFVTRMTEPLGDLVAAVHRKALVLAIMDLIDGGIDGDS